MPLSVSLQIGFWDKDYVSQLLCVRYYVQEGLCVLGA